MALKFLNKKGWHTGSLRNIETVWKAEQKHEGEQKKLEELRKQIQDEREKSEFRLMQEQAGLVPKQERLEFLYDSGLQVGKVAQADEYLLGKPVEEVAQPENDVGQVAAKPGALFVEEKPASANDSWRKLHSDPLFLIKQQEQAALARITSNPVKMAGIKKAAEMKKKLKEEKKRKRKEAKRERREKRKRKKHHASSSEEDSSDSDESPKKRKHKHDSDADDDHKYRKAQAKFSRSPTRSPVHKDRRPSPRRSKGEERQYEKRKSPSRSPVHRDNDRGRSRRDGYDSRGASKLEGRQREHRGNDKEFEGRESERRKRSRSASRSPVPRDRDRRLKGSDGRDSEKRKWIPSRSPLRSRSPVRGSVVRRDHDQSRARRDEFDTRGRQREYKGSDERLKRPEDRDYGMRGRSPPRRPSRSPGRRNYGLNRARRDDLDYRGEPRHREHTSVDQRLKEPVDEDSRPRDSKELERGSKSANNGVAASNDVNGLSSRQAHKGRPPKPGHQQLSDAERAARLKEMQANADVHEEQRWQRLKRAADADVVEAKRTEKDKSNEQFIADTQKSFFGAEKGNASTIEKSVKRRAHFVERSSGDNERNAFRR